LASPLDHLAKTERAKAWPGSGFRFAAAVGPAGRLPCGARSRGLPQNSLRSLRSLRSDTCAKSETGARCARRPRALRSSAPQRRCTRRPATPLRIGGGSPPTWACQSKGCCGIVSDRSRPSPVAR